MLASNISSHLIDSLIYEQKAKHGIVEIGGSNWSEHLDFRAEPMSFLGSRIVSPTFKGHISIIEDAQKVLSLRNAALQFRELETKAARLLDPDGAPWKKVSTPLSLSTRAARLN